MPCACLYFFICLRAFIFLLAFIFFTCLTCPHFFTCLSCFYFFTCCFMCLALLHVLCVLSLRAFFFLLVLHAFNFYESFVLPSSYLPYVHLFFTCLTCLHIFTCLRDLIFLRAFISCRFFCALMFLRALLAFIFHVPWVSQFFYVFYMPAFFYVPFGPSFFTCLTCLFFLLKFWRALSVFTFFYKIWNNPEPTATSRISRNECGFFFKIFIYLILNYYYESSHCENYKNSLQNSLIQILVKNTFEWIMF